MLTRSRTFLIALASLIGLASPAPAQDFAENLISPGKLVVGTSQGGLAASTGPNGELVGYDIEYVKQLANDLHLKPEFVVIDFSGLLPGLIAGRFDIAAATMGRTKVRAESPDLILGPGYGFDDVAFMKLTSTTSVSDWQSICGKRIGAVRGAFSQRLAASKLPSGCFTEVAYPSIAEMVLDLKNGRLDAVVSARSLLRGFAKDSEVPLTVSNNTVRPYSFGLAISKTNPELAKKIGELTNQYVTDGTMDRIMKTFGIQLDWSLMKQASEPF